MLSKETPGQKPDFLQSIYSMCGKIDIRLKQLQKRAIFQVGLSKNGKSTLYNHANHVTLIGVAPESNQDEFDDFGSNGAAIDVIYKPKIAGTDLAEANNDVKSVTLVPNISPRKDYPLVDLPGYLDKRRYNDVIGVSYVIKCSFKIVEQCQFVLVMKNDYFRGGQEEHLFKSLLGFVNMFNFESLSENLKEKILQSVTFVISKAGKNQKIQSYGRKMAVLLKQGLDSNYGEYQTVKKVAYVMEYFSKHPEQIYLFYSAQIGQDSPPSTLAEDHLSKRPYFELKKENEKYYQQKNKHIYRLPFAEDYAQMIKKDKSILDEYNQKIKAQSDEKKRAMIKKPQTDKELLQIQFQNRVRSFKQYAKILEKFFKKAIIPTNLFSQKLNFKDEFDEMKQYVKKYNVYPGFDIKEETQFKTRFSIGDPSIKLRLGMKLARNVFQLYKKFSQLPAYNNEDDPIYLESFMKNYKNYLIELTTLFRDTFCTKYEQEQTIMNFLFIGVRGCKQFSVLYEITPEGKHSTCQNLQDSFFSILDAQPLIKLQEQFLFRLNENINSVEEEVKENNDQISEYVKFLKGLEQDEDSKSITTSQNYKKLKRKLLELRSQTKTQSPQQKLLSIFENFNQHKKFVEEKIRQLEDDEGDYPEQYNFKFLHQLSSIGRIILRLNRHNNISADNFASQRADEVQVMRGNRSVQQFLVIEQAQTAMEIFTYIKDTVSVIEAFEIILKNLPANDHADRLNYLKSIASYCLKNGRQGEAIVNYQKALQTCIEANLEKDYKEIKKAMMQIPSRRDQVLAAFYGDLGMKEIIDPEYDENLKVIVRNIETYFIDPYQNRQNANDARHGN